jgi:hypothetical protein
LLGDVGEYDEAVPMLVRGIDACPLPPLDSQNNLEHANQALTKVLVTSLREGRSLPPRSELGSFGESDTYDMLCDFADGLAGSGEALARLPGELRSLIDQAR